MIEFKVCIRDYAYAMIIKKTSCVSDEDTGSIEFRFDGTPSHDATLLLDSMILGLEEIEDSNDYEKYIDIIFKEV